MRSLAAGAVIMMGAQGIGLAAAQSLPPQADPGRVQERISPPPITPGGEQGIDIPAVSPEPAPAGAEQIRFTLSAVTLSGNSAMATEDLAPLYQAHVGQEVSLATLYEIAAAITNAYRARGYILSQALVPAQRIVEGRVNIVVVEGRIDRVTVQGDDSSGRIAAIAQQIADEAPLTGDTMERYLLLIQDLAGVKARAVLSPSQEVQGAADLTLVLERDPIDGFASIDNRGSATTGPYQATLGVNLNNGLGQDERLSLVVLTAPIDDELYYGQVKLEQPIGTEGTTVSLSVSKSLTTPGSTLAPFENEGDSISYEVALSHPLIRSRALTLNGEATLSWRDATSDFFTSTSPVRVYDDHLRVLRLGLSLDTQDESGGRTSAGVTVSQGLNVAGASEAGDSRLSRGNGDPQFTSIAGRVSHSLPFGGQFAVKASGQFQYAFDPLLASEEIGFGGTSSGSAFSSSIISGDSGIGGRVEVIWFWSVPPEGDFNLLVQGQTYTFIDGGAIWQMARPLGERAHDGISSTGLGTRFQLEDQVYGGWELAFPIDNPADEPKPRSARLFFQLGASF